MGAKESKLPPAVEGSEGGEDEDAFNVQFTPALMHSLVDSMNGGDGSGGGGGGGDAGAGAAAPHSAGGETPRSLEAAYNKGAQDMRDFLDAQRHEERERIAAGELAR